jgi:hypothetical protein
MNKAHSTQQRTQADRASRAQRKANVTRPTLATPAGVLQLQRTAGNRAVNRLIQAKLTVGAAHDPLEQEADRVADRVVSGAAHTAPSSHASTQDVHRNAAEEDELMMKRISIQRAPQEEDELMMKRDPAIQRAPEEDELMTKRSAMLGSFDAGPAFERQLRGAGGGKALEPHTRSEMERGIGADFSNVRVHTGAQASQLNRSISARAFTRGKDVFFAGGQYNPGSSAGKRLIAHELTHVVQQGGAAQAGVQRKTAPRIQRDFWDRFKKKRKKQESAAPQTAAWKRQGYRDSDNVNVRTGLSTAGYRVGENRRMFNDFKWMEQAMSNNMDMADETESNYYMNQGRAKANAHASDMDQFDYMQDQMSNAWWALHGQGNPLWQKANESFRAPRQSPNNQFLSKNNQQRWLGEKGMQMAGKQKVDPHDPFKTYKGGDIFTAEANGDPDWDQHAGKRMAHVENEGNDQLPGYEQVPDSYGPGIESPAELIDLGETLDTVDQVDVGEEGSTDSDVEMSDGGDVDVQDAIDQTTNQVKTENGVASRPTRPVRDYTKFNAHQTAPTKKKGMTAKRLGRIMDNNLNPVTIVKKLQKAIPTMNKISADLNKWERAISIGDQMLSAAFDKSLSGITTVKLTPRKVTSVALLTPVQGPYILALTMRAKNLSKKHREKWPVFSED